MTATQHDAPKFIKLMDDFTDFMGDRWKWTTYSSAHGYGPDIMDVPSNANGGGQ